MKLHYFIGQKKSPHHLSVGAVVMNSNKQVYCHHVRGMHGKKDSYVLMRETVRPNDSLKEALKRGLKKEFGMRAEVRRYLGSVTSSFVNWQGANVQKTTLYFLCKPVDVPKKVHWQEKPHKGTRSSAEWRSIRFLVQQMRKQRRALKRSDFDESEVLKRI